VLVAIIANHGQIALIPFLTGNSPTPPVTSVSTTQIPVTFTVVPTPTPQAILTLKPPAPPYLISLTKNPFSYPVIHLPDNMETYGVSNTPLRENESVPFAYVQDSQGGLTTIFSVPYAVWALNISVTANSYPQYALFNMVLCDAKTGTIITGAEILHGGTMYKVVRNSGSMYMIIGVNYVDSYKITLETPFSYYEKANAPA
jgi:hypothetical protein